MSAILLVIILLAILIMLVILTYYLRTVELQTKQKEEAGEQFEERDRQRVPSAQNFIFTAIIFTCISVLVAIYFSLKGTIWEGHMMEWLNIIVRLMHIGFGIAWIGASFYFVFLENALNRTRDVRDELAGNLWAIHGGGFYYLEKYKVAPKSIPKHLHWFKYEAYFTWISGFCLLFVVYYFNASGMLVDKNVWDISALAAICTGIGSLVAGWIIYDLICKTALVRSKWFGPAGLILCTGFAFFYSHVFSSRAAYMHFGALLGTIMAANVFFVIIPSQKAMVKAAKLGIPVDPALGKNAGRRSLHNNYLTFPVLFVMISNHFPSTFGSEYPWLILAIITLGTAGVKHYLNLKEKGEISVWILPASVIILLAAAFLSAPAKPGECKENISISEVNSIVQQRCISCHSSRPSDPAYTSPPNGVKYETPADIAKLKDKILQRVVVTKTMPLNNKTNMTDKERDMIRCWIDQGAQIK